MNPKMIVLLALGCAPQLVSAQSTRMARVTLAAPTAQVEPMVVDGLVWRCTDAGCTGPAGNGRTGDQHLCHEIARKAGIVAAYATPRGALTPEELVRCNRGIAAAR